MKCETLGADTTVSRLAPVTSAATATNKGNWVNLGVTTFDWTSFGITFEVAINNNVAILDVAYGDNIIIPNLIMAMSFHQSTAITLCSMPLFIPSGATVRVRAQSAVTSTTVARVSVTGRSDYNKCYRSLDVYGVDTTSISSVLVDPGGTTNTKGPWTAIGTASKQYDKMFCTVYPSTFPTNPSSANSMLLDVGVGPADNPTRVIKDQFFNVLATAYPIGNRIVSVTDIDIFPGDVIQARMQSTTATTNSRSLRVAAYCFYDAIPGRNASNYSRSLVKS